MHHGKMANADNELVGCCVPSCAHVKANGQLDKRGDWLRVVMVVMAIVLRGLWKKLNAREAIYFEGRYR
jgi:hypothetical protein